MSKVPDNDASKMHFRCVLRCTCAIVHLSLPSLYLERSAISKIWSVVWFKLFHKSNLYQVNKTLLNLHFHCFSYSIPPIYYLSHLWGNRNLVHWFNNSLGRPSLFWDLEGHRNLLHTMNSSRKCQKHANNQL